MLHAIACSHAALQQAAGRALLPPGRTGVLTCGLVFPDGDAAATSQWRRRTLADSSVEYWERDGEVSLSLPPAAWKVGTLEDGREYRWRETDDPDDDIFGPVAGGDDAVRRVCSGSTHGPGAYSPCNRRPRRSVVQRLDARAADVYAFGRLAHVVATGLPPRNGVESALPGRLAALLREALASDVDARPDAATLLAKCQLL